MTYTTVANKVFEKYYGREINEELVNEIREDLNGKGKIYDRVLGLGYVGMGDYILAFDDVEKLGGNFTKIQVLVPIEDDVEVKYEKTRG